MANPNPKPPPKHSQFKPGNNANPIGARAQRPEIRKLSKLTIDTYREVIELVLTGDLDALKAMINHPKTPAIQVGLATSMLKAIKNGDPGVFERFAERIVGKIPDVINVNANTNANVNSKVTVVDEVVLKAAMLKIQGDV